MWSESYLVRFPVHHFLVIGAYITLDLVVEYSLGSAKAPESVSRETGSEVSFGDSPTSCREAKDLFPRYPIY